MTGGEKSNKEKKKILQKGEKKKEEINERKYIRL